MHCSDLSADDVDVAAPPVDIKLLHLFDQVPGNFWSVFVPRHQNALFLMLSKWLQHQYPGMLPPITDIRGWDALAQQLKQYVAKTFVRP